MAGKATGSAAVSTPSEISPSGQAIANSVDLLTEILLRLPAKSLIRFKSVSKYCLSLISHPQFAATHSARNPSPIISDLYFYSDGRLDSVSLHPRNPSSIISGLYFYSDGQLDSVSLHGHRNLLPSLSFLDGLDAKYLPTTIQHSCNGLLLFQTRYLDPNGYRSSSVFIVCNPTTNKYTILPETGIPSRLTCVRSAYLAFDPSKSPHYKVIVTSQYYFNFNVEIDVYDSKSRNWRNVSQKQETGLGRGVYWKGAIHWLSYRSTSLLKFDVNADKMIALTSRSKITYSVYSYFGECGGRLILIPAHSPSSMEFPILEYLEESENSRWIVKYRVNLRIVVSVFPEMKNVFKCCVLGVVERSKMKQDYAMVLGIRGKVISYNLKSKTMDVLRDLAPGGLIRDVDDFAYSFVETLSPV